MMTPSENDRHDLFLRLYVEHEEALHGFVRTLVPTRDDAREVMQEVAVVAWRRFEELTDTKDFRRWAFGVAKFKALAFARDQMRDRLVFDPEVMDLLAAEIETEADTLHAEREALDECLGKLEPAQRKLLDAAYAPGVRMDALAVSLGRSPMAFYKTLHRIRLVLMDCTQRVLKREETA
jgi:RNA polymerase sigma-70 factor (ECF subfamily)